MTGIGGARRGGEEGRAGEVVERRAEVAAEAVGRGRGVLCWGGGGGEGEAGGEHNGCLATSGVAAARSEH